MTADCPTLIIASDGFQNAHLLNKTFSELNPPVEVLDDPQRRRFPGIPISRCPPDDPVPEIKKPLRAFPGVCNKRPPPDPPEGLTQVTNNDVKSYKLPPPTFADLLRSKKTCLTTKSSENVTKSEIHKPDTTEVRPDISSAHPTNEEATSALKSCDITSSSSLKKSKQSKKLLWQTIEAANLKGSLWDQSQESKTRPKGIESLSTLLKKKKQELNKLRVNYERLSQLFTISQDSQKSQFPKNTRRCSLKLADNTECVKIFDSKRRQKIEICIKGLGISDNLSALYRTLDYCETDEYIENPFSRPVISNEYLSPESLQMILNIFPTPLEEQALKSHKDNPLLDKAEIFLSKLLEVPGLGIKIECCLFRCTTADDISNLRAKLDCLLEPSGHMIESLKTGILKELFLTILNIGNFLNQDSKQGELLGFTVDSLFNLKSTKSYDGSTTLLKLLAEMCTENPLIWTELESLFKSITNRLNFSLADLTTTHSQLFAKTNKLQKRVELLPEGPFRSNFDKFMKAILSELDRLDKNKQLISNNLIEICTLLAEKTTTPEAGFEALCHLEKFWKEFSVICRQLIEINKRKIGFRTAQRSTISAGFPVTTSGRHSLANLEIDSIKDMKNKFSIKPSKENKFALDMTKAVNMKDDAYLYNDSTSRRNREQYPLAEAPWTTRDYDPSKVYYHNLNDKLKSNTSTSSKDQLKHLFEHTSLEKNHTDTISNMKGQGNSKYGQLNITELSQNNRNDQRGHLRSKKQGDNSLLSHQSLNNHASFDIIDRESYINFSPESSRSSQTTKPKILNTSNSPSSIANLKNRNDKISSSSKLYPLNLNSKNNNSLVDSHPYSQNRESLTHRQYSSDKKPEFDKHCRRLTLYNSFDQIAVGSDETNHLIGAETEIPSGFVTHRKYTKLPSISKVDPSELVNRFMLSK